MDIVERLMSAAITTSGRMSANHRLEVSEALIDAATEIARLRKDAERYRLIRDSTPEQFDKFEPGLYSGGDELDELIDAAMQGPNYS